MRIGVAAFPLILWLLPAPSVVRACTLDNVASVSANGERAVLSASQPQAGQPWAPFDFAQAYAVGTRLTLGEARSDLERSLPPALLATSFRWAMGDGSIIRGVSVAHRYARSGNYLVQVYAYAESRTRWVLFDSVLIHIVPGSQLLRANLGYDALRGFDLMLSWLSRLITGALVLLLVYVVVSYVRSGGKAPAPGPES